MYWNIEKGQQGKNQLLNRLLRKLFAFSWMKNKNFQFSKFSCIFCLSFDSLRGLECFKSEEKVNEEKVGCPVGFFEKIIAMIWTKMSHIDTKCQNSQTFPIFKNLCVFSNFSTVFLNWNNGKGQEEKNVSSSMLRKEINTLFSNKNFRNWHWKRQKIKNFPIFSIFFQLCQNLYRLHGLDGYNA